MIKEMGEKEAVARLKERLNRYRDMEKDIDNQIERLERLESKLTTVGSPVLSGMPGSPNVQGDRISTLIGQKEQMETDLRDEIKSHEREWNAIEKLICHLHSADERAVIRMHYHDGELWNDVSRMIFSGKPDYEAKQKVYLRRVFRLHGKALLEMARAEENGV